MNTAVGDFVDIQCSRMSIPYSAEQLDIGGLVVWLASEEGRYVTKTGITLDSGTNVCRATRQSKVIQIAPWLSA